MLSAEALGLEIRQLPRPEQAVFVGAALVVMLAMETGPGEICESFSRFSESGLHHG